MTAARDQAREAARASARRDEIDTMRGADVASDVWEPLLQNLVYLIPYASSTEAIILSDAYARAREALR